MWSYCNCFAGDTYNQVAGVDSFVNIILYDAWKNRITTGNNYLELVLLGVAVEWGTIQPWGTTPGLPNAHHYKGNRLCHRVNVILFCHVHCFVISSLIACTPV